MANAFVNDAAEFDSTATIAETQAPAAGFGAFLRTIAHRVHTSRQRKADAEIGRFLESRGGKLTDDLERQISRRFGTHSGRY